MMKNILTVLISAIVLMSLLSACGSKDEETVNTAPFQSAIRDYCKSKNMGMKVSSFEKMEVKGDNATAVCKMQEAEGTYNVSVSWKLTFKQENGKWKVVSQEKK